MISLNALKNNPGAKRHKMRVGCGNGSGKGGTSGRGHKGQYARSGHKHKPAFEGGQMRLIRRLPKRGFNSRDKHEYVPVDVAALEQFEVGAEITPGVIMAAGLARGGDVCIKILGKGPVSKALTVKAHAFSAGAKDAIEKAGGTIEKVS